MIDTNEFLIHARVNAEVLEVWIEAGWVVPRRDADDQRFSDVDLARALLIRDLQHDMGVNEEGVSVVLDLIDQIHGLRRTLRELLSAVCEEPETRDRIVTSIRERRSLAGPGTCGIPFPCPGPRRA